MVFIPVIIKIDNKTRRLVMKSFGVMEKSGLVRNHPYRDDIIIRLMGNVYVDGDYNFFICNDTCEKSGYLRDQYFKMLEMLEKMKGIKFKEISINGVRYSRWI